MRIVVNHLTRMQTGYMCVAGIDMHTWHHVRPVSAAGRLSTNLLTRNGGPFDMAVVLDIGTPGPLKNRPEVEDHLVNLSIIKTIRNLQERQFWRLLNRVAETSLVKVFGEDLLQIGRGSCAVKVGKGLASLGCIIPSSNPYLYIRKRSDRRDQIRLRFNDSEFYLDCSVTDIRLYAEDHVTPDEKLVERVANRLRGDEGLILSVGLTRPFAGSADFEPVHWLQVNNIHLQNEPTWQLG